MYAELVNFVPKFALVFKNASLICINSEQVNLFVNVGL